MSQTTRVLHVFARMDKGGAELRTVELMRRLGVSNPVRMEFAAVSGRTGRLDAEIRALGGTVHYPRPGPGFPIQFLLLLRRHRPDVVHSHVYLMSGIILLLGALARVPVRVAHFRTTGTDTPRTARQRLTDAMNRFLLDRCATHIIGVSEGALHHVWSENWREDARCRIIYPGIDPDSGFSDTRSQVRASLGISNDAHLYIHVGRMEPPKNHRRLLDIFREIHDRDPDAVLLLIGRGGNSLEAELRSAVAESRLTDRVIFLGERDDVRRILNAADVMIFPSLREGLPGAVTEAVAAGVPVVGSKLPGVEEISWLISGVTVLGLYETDGAWADAAVKLLQDRGESDLTDIRGTVLDVNVSLEEHLRIWTTRR